MNKEDKWRQLQNVINLRSSEDQVTWTIFGIFCAATAILLVALFPDGEFTSSPERIIIAGVGLFLSFIWYKIQNRGLKYVEWYEELAGKLENDLEIEDSLRITTKLNPNGSKKLLSKGTRARTWMRASSLTITLGWGCAFVLFIIFAFFC